PAPLLVERRQRPEPRARAGPWGAPLAPAILNARLPFARFASRPGAARPARARLPSPPSRIDRLQRRFLPAQTEPAAPTGPPPPSRARGLRFALDWVVVNRKIPARSQPDDRKFACHGSVGLSPGHPAPLHERPRRQ